MQEPIVMRDDVADDLFLAVTEDLVSQLPCARNTSAR
jgi:hypothetical protein